MHDEYHGVIERMHEIRAELQQLADTPENELTDADEARFRRIETEFRTLDDRRQTMELTHGLRQGHFKSVPGAPTPGRNDYDLPDDTGVDRGVRTAAMRQLERSVADGTMGAKGAETVERLMSVGHRGERTWVARWAEVAGDSAYLSAFQKRLAYGEFARDRFSQDEVEAVRRVGEFDAETRAMSTTDVSGGFLIPVQLDPAILLSSDGSVNPIRAMARVEQVVGEKWRGVSSAGASSRWAPEASEANDDSPDLGQPEVPVHKGDSFVPYSIEIEQDGAGFVSEVSRVMLDSILQLQNSAYTTGSGVGQPTGFITALVAAGAPIVVPGDGTEALDDNDPVKLQNALPPRFQGNSAFAANLTTINTFRFSETTNGALKFPSLQNSPPMLLGRRMHEISDMDGEIDTGATENNYVLALGDWSRFLIADKIGTRVEMISHLFGANGRPTGQRGFYAYFRTGSDVLTPEAFTLLNVATTS